MFSYRTIHVCAIVITNRPYKQEKNDVRIQTIISPQIRTLEFEPKKIYNNFLFRLTLNGINPLILKNYGKNSKIDKVDHGNANLNRVAHLVKKIRLNRTSCSRGLRATAKSHKLKKRIWKLSTVKQNSQPLTDFPLLICHHFLFENGPIIQKKLVIPLLYLFKSTPSLMMTYIVLL